ADMRRHRPRTTRASEAAPLDVLRAIEGLRAFPNRGRPGRVQGTRELVLTRPFLAVYVATRPADVRHERRRNGYGVSPPVLDRMAASERSSDSTSAGSATVSAISWRNNSRYLFRRR